MDLLIHYSAGVQLLPGLPTNVAQYKIKDAKPKHDKIAFILRVSNNIHGIPCLENADLQEEWVEEEKIPVKKDVPAPPKPEAKKEGAEADKAPENQGQDTEMKEEDKQ